MIKAKIILAFEYDQILFTIHFTFITSQLKLLQNATKVTTKCGSIEKIKDFFNFKIHLVQKLNKKFALKNNENLIKLFSILPAPKPAEELEK